MTKTMAISSGSDRRSEQAKSVTATSPEPVEAKARHELADNAGVGSRTMDKVEHLSKHADDSIKQKLRKGDTTINVEYKRLNRLA